MKRIGIVVPVFPFPSETFIATKVVGLMDRGFDVTIFSTKQSVYWERFHFLKSRQDVRDRVVVSVLQYRHRTFLFLFRSAWLIITKFISNPRQSLNLFTRLRRTNSRFRDFSIQFLHQLMFVGSRLDLLHIEFDSQAFGLCELKYVLKCKLLLSGRGSTNLTSAGYAPGFYEYIFAHVDHYHFISNYLLSLSRRFGLPQSVPVTLIEPAIDLSLFNPAPRAKPAGDKIILVSVGRLTWAKGYEFALDAIALIAQSTTNFEYWILGEGPYRDAILFAAEQHGLTSRGIVHFSGAVHRETVNTYLQKADILIHAALEEGFCNAVIEAQAMEVPVVTFDSGGLPENVEHAVSGFVVPRRDAQAMARHVLELMGNPELRNKMGKAGRDRATKRFDIKDQLHKFEKLYESI